MIASVSRLPARYQEQLTSAASDLVGRIQPCPPPADEEKPEPANRGKHKRKRGHD